MKLYFRRRTGKTTRTIDDAIQRLFRDGEIWIPSSSLISDFNSQASGKTDEEIKKFSKFSIIDDEWEVNSSIQIGLITRIINRLESEHAGSFKVFRNISNLTKIITKSPFEKN